MAQLEHLEALEKHFWTAAGPLRANSNYASNEDFLPGMGLIFLRHAYSRYLSVKDKIEAKLPTREFDDIAYRFLQQVRTLKKQQMKLIEARDLLLPHFLNGEIAV